MSISTDPATTSTLSSWRSWRLGVPGDSVLWRRFRRHRLALIGLAVLIGFGLMAIFADALALRSPNRVDMDSIKAPPSAQHVLGTDAAGRDVYARLVHGARISMSV